jgi:hypothetical protein
VPRSPTLLAPHPQVRQTHAAAPQCRQLHLKLDLSAVAALRNSAPQRTHPTQSGGPRTADFGHPAGLGTVPAGGQTPPASVQQTCSLCAASGDATSGEMGAQAGTCDTAVAACGCQHAAPVADGHGGCASGEGAEHDGGQQARHGEAGTMPPPGSSTPQVPDSILAWQEQRIAGDATAPASTERRSLAPPRSNGDPFLAAAAAVAAASGRASAAWRSATTAERVALLGKRWYGDEHPTSGGVTPTAGGAPPSRHGTVVNGPGAHHPIVPDHGRPASTFAKPPRLILRADGSTVIAPPGSSDGDAMIGGDEATAVTTAQRARKAAAGRRSRGHASGGTPSGNAGTGGAAARQQEVGSTGTGATWHAARAALAPLLQFPIAPLHRSSYAAGGRQQSPAAAASELQQYHAMGIPASRVPTAPRSRTARRASWNAAYMGAAPSSAAADTQLSGWPGVSGHGSVGLHSCQPASRQQAPASTSAPPDLAAVLGLARRGTPQSGHGGGNHHGGRVPGPGAGLPGLFSTNGGSSHAKAAPPSFAFELLPRMVSLSRHDVSADLR